MKHLELTAEDMADLVAGSTINVPLEDGEVITVAAPDGVNEGWHEDPDVRPIRMRKDPS